MSSTSITSKSHLKVRAGRRKKKSTGQGWWMGVTPKQLAELRKQQRPTKKRKTQ